MKPTCACACHVGGAFRPACDVPGGCGSNHADRVDVDLVAEVARQSPAAPQPATRRENIGLLVDQLLRGWREDHRHHIKGESSWRIGLLRLIAVQLEPVQFTTNEHGGRGGKVSGSPSPWADDLAGIWIDVHAGARVLEADLHEAIHGNRLPARERVGTIFAAGFLPAFHVIERQVIRGRSDENTAAALLNAVDLVGQLERTTPGHPLIGRVERKLSEWVRRARHALGHDRKWNLVPAPCSATWLSCAVADCLGEQCETYDDGVVPDCCAVHVCGADAVRQNPYNGSARCMACGTTWSASELDWVATAAQTYAAAPAVIPAESA